MRSLKNQKGQSLVEFAIILPILLLLVMGILQFALMMNAYLAVENASREGARAGIVGSTDDEILQLITTTSPSLDPTKLTLSVTPAEADRKSGDTLTVSITYNFVLIVPIISTMFGNEVVLNGQTSMRIE